jgi:uncharacterized RmlC-like cupin family protein
MNYLPEELRDYFSSSHFANYPKIVIPQSFQDDRGLIINIADGKLGDVAIIHSIEGATRANHVHETDWHLSYCVTGSLIYSYIEEGTAKRDIEIKSGDLFFTPAKIPHRMEFSSDTILVVVSRNSRKSDKYEEDTKKFILESNTAEKKGLHDHLS